MIPATFYLFWYHGLYFNSKSSLELALNYVSLIFTFLVNGLMMPMQIKQQKFSKMSMIMNPEIQAIQKKYKNKKEALAKEKC